MTTTTAEVGSATATGMSEIVLESTSGGMAMMDPFGPRQRSWW